MPRAFFGVAAPMYLMRHSRRNDQERLPIRPVIYVAAARAGSPARANGRASESRFSALVIANADGFVDAADKDLAIADVAGASGAQNRSDHLLL